MIFLWKLHILTFRILKATKVASYRKHKKPNFLEIVKIALEALKYSGKLVDATWKHWFLPDFFCDVVFPLIVA